ncbi:MAG: serine hydrolase domain-containing protein, partial [Flavobacteriaceae bacterium]
MNFKQISVAFLFLIVPFQFGLNAQDLQKAAPEEVGVSSVRINNLTKVLESYVHDKKLSGAVALIARKNKIIYFEAVGKRDVESNSVMKEDAIFRIASQTKAIVSVGVMMLQEEGKLLISDPLSKYIPEFKETTVAVSNEDGGYDIIKAKRAITLRDLLTHS